VNCPLQLLHATVPDRFVGKQTSLEWYSVEILVYFP
jgi:hypothetical protein